MLLISTIFYVHVFCTDPCMFSNGGCSDICTSDPVTQVVTCSCPEDAEIDSTGTMCQRLRVECPNPIRQKYNATVKTCVGNVYS